MIKAAGILFIADDKALLLKRSTEGDHAREWALTGGKIEEGETPEQAARREFEEECGFTYNGKLLPISHTDDGNVEFTTFAAIVADQFKPTLNDEHTAYMWCPLDDYPNKTHPAVKALLNSGDLSDRLSGKVPDQQEIADCSTVRADSAEVETETDIAKKIRDKVLTSPQRFANVWLFAIRITGTGVAYRPKLDEFTHRDPDNYLNDEFLERCNGLPVIWVHPPSDRLDSASFAERVVGTVCLPYIAENEVWGIAKIFDDDAAQAMQDERLSTSPGVVFQAGTNTVETLKDGTAVLIEGVPKLLDHIAIVENGVWDKGGEPSGILASQAHVEMTEASRNDSADQTDSLVTKEGEVNMAETTANPMEQMLALLQGIQSTQAEILTQGAALETRIAALEKAEQAEIEAQAKGDEGATPSAPLPVDATAATPAADAAPAAVAQAPAVDLNKARMDALESEVTELRKKLPTEMTDEEKAKLIEAQAKADRADSARGDSAPRPLAGDTAVSYTHRQLARHINHSPRWKDKASSVAQINDPALLGTIADEVYADSVAASRSCEGIPEDKVIPIKSMNGGCETTTFLGKSSFVKGMSQRPM
jgi:8-oxo-dGTP pyrophosphatase MutT (NUDIX family)